MKISECNIKDLREIVTKQGDVVEVVPAEFADPIKDALEMTIQMDLNVQAITEKGIEWLVENESDEPTEDDVDYYLRKGYGF